MAVLILDKCYWGKEDIYIVTASEKCGGLMPLVSWIYKLREFKLAPVFDKSHSLLYSIPYLIGFRKY